MASVRPGRAMANYAAALLLSFAAAAATHALAPLTGQRFPLAAFPAAVVVSAWIGGFAPGLFATLASALIADFFLLHPTRSFAVGPAEGIGLLLFVLSGVLISAAVRHLELGAFEEHGIRLDAERRLRRTRQIQDLITALSRARRPADVINAALPELLHAVDADAGVVAVAADRDAEFAVVHAIGYGEDSATLGYTVSVYAKTLLADSIRRHELVARQWRGDPDVSCEVDPFLDAHEAAVIVPLVTGGRAVGAIALAFARAHLFSDEEREFLFHAGRRTAQALERARLYDMAERARVEAEESRQRADIELRERQRMEEALRASEGRYRALAARTRRLYTLSARLSEAVSVEAVARATVEEGKLVVGASAGSLALASGSEFEVIFADDGVERPAGRFPAESGMCTTAAVETRRPVFVGSFSEWQHDYPRSASMIADGGFASAAVLPLLADGAAIGVLSFYFTAPVKFDDEYQPLLTSVATHCTQALDRARLYETAQRARDEAEAANQAKDDFLSTVSHELRTPLNAILGWASMLRDRAADPSRQGRAIEAIISSGTRQLQLVEELLDVSRIVAGRTSVDLQPVALADIVRGAVEAIMPVAETRGIEVAVKPLADVQVHADPRRLEQVFLNLLSNAVKFTPGGGRVTVEAQAGPVTTTVRVSDTGRGIDPGFLPHVFERFRQADPKGARSGGGLGLGLFIARHLVEAHGGQIHVESGGAGQGSTFSVSLPVSETVESDHDPSLQRHRASHPPERIH